MYLCIYSHEMTKIKISSKIVISLQFFCGAEMAYSPSSKAKNRKGNNNEISFNAATKALISAYKKELSLRHCWVTLCINASRLC